MAEEKEKRKRGLAAASPEVRKRVATEGGKAVQRMRTGARWTAEQAREAVRLRGDRLLEEEEEGEREGEEEER